MKLSILDLPCFLEWRSTSHSLFLPQMILIYFSQYTLILDYDSTETFNPYCVSTDGFKKHK